MRRSRTQSAAGAMQTNRIIFSSVIFPAKFNAIFTWTQFLEIYSPISFSCSPRWLDSITTYADVIYKALTTQQHVMLRPQFHLARLDSTRLDSTRSTLSSQSSQSSESRRACQARRAALFQYGGRRTSYSVRLHKFSRFYALAYTNPICFVCCVLCMLFSVRVMGDMRMFNGCYNS